MELPPSSLSSSASPWVATWQEKRKRFAHVSTYIKEDINDIFNALPTIKLDQPKEPVPLSPQKKSPQKSGSLVQRIKRKLSISSGSKSEMPLIGQPLPIIQDPIQISLTKEEEKTDEKKPEFSAEARVFYTSLWDSLTSQLEKLCTEAEELPQDAKVAAFAEKFSKIQTEFNRTEKEFSIFDKNRDVDLSSDTTTAEDKEKPNLLPEQKEEIRKKILQETFTLSNPLNSLTAKVAEVKATIEFLSLQIDKKQNAEKQQSPPLPAFAKPRSLTATATNTLYNKRDAWEEQENRDPDLETILRKRAASIGQKK